MDHSRPRVGAIVCRPRLLQIGLEDGGDVIHRQLTLARCLGCGDVMLQMLAEQLDHQALRRAAKRGHLGQQRGAVHVLRQGFFQPFHLPADPAHAREQSGFVLIEMCHRRIPPRGI
ncbi:hypothetical protein XAC2852_820158 [Xanthomonas citri pv. citri]|nr:hypothetical protein XAC2852_820158 [Xanthomonas citri pv. citri]